MKNHEISPPANETMASMNTRKPDMVNPFFVVMIELVWAIRACKHDGKIKIASGQM